MAESNFRDWVANPRLVGQSIQTKVFSTSADITVNACDYLRICLTSKELEKITSLLYFQNHQLVQVTCYYLFTLKNQFFLNKRSLLTFEMKTKLE